MSFPSRALASKVTAPRVAAISAARTRPGSAAVCGISPKKSVASSSGRRSTTFVSVSSFVAPASTSKKQQRAMGNLWSSPAATAQVRLEHTGAALDGGSTTGPAKESIDVHGPLGQGMRQKLIEELSPIFYLEMEDESHEHRGHAGVRDATTAETHFRVVVVSDKFEGISRVQRQQRVYGILKEEFQTQGLHALSLKCLTTSEYEKL
ncbi:unnamed protein product [Amoebophrya sp. A120]|nr:unnamed protein product [Amoebophrya sp. A120]|eukprot:GSA120T00024041001.1